jgi:hypothetical protein
MRIKTKIDLEQLAIEIRNLKPTQSLYVVLKKELGAIGHWKQFPRGKPRDFKGIKGEK